MFTSAYRYVDVEMSWIIFFTVSFLISWPYIFYLALSLVCAFQDCPLLWSTIQNWLFSSVTGFPLLNLNLNKTGLTYTKVGRNPLTFHIFCSLASCILHQRNRRKIKQLLGKTVIGLLGVFDLGCFTHFFSLKYF